jgi:two-component system chemotaxis response regulator CheB
MRRDIIVIGASAGGIEALKRLVSEIPKDIPASLFVVVHLSHEPSLLPEILSRAGKLPARHPVDNEPIEPARIYVARPNRHMLIQPGRVRVYMGPKENGHRPSIDFLFRSAAREYGSRVAGVVLSGMRDDGVAGLWAIKSQGGAAIVQDPEEALFPSMPYNALTRIEVDFCTNVSAIGGLIARLADGTQAGVSRP